MKRFFPLWILLSVTCAFVLGVWAGNTVLVGTLTTVNNTTNASSSVVIGTTSANPGTLLITDGGLTQTNALNVALQWSLDNTNFVTEASYFPTSTNAATFTWTPSISAQSIYERVFITTTNNVSVGVILQQ